MQPSFPFSAIVGQETLKRALLLAVIQPSLGGVLIRGTKGVAKSTAVRALASLLPPIEVVVGCPFQRRPAEQILDWPLPNDAAVALRPLPLIELPLGATEDRLLGALHLEKALRGERAFEPGLLAAANRGILYVDEVNLLPDHLVDVLLDAAASGMHRVEREGLSLSHPARFVLIGTMNPEEGELRPQLLDRFGLVVDLSDLTEVEDRVEVVRRRLAYEGDAAAFVTAWSDADAAEAQRIVRAQALLPRVQVPDMLVRDLSERCLAAGVQGLRADLTLCKAACAWAAYQGRTAVESADLGAVAELALAHRRTRPPEPPGGPRTEDRGSKIEDRGLKREDRGSRIEDRESRGDDRQPFSSPPLGASVNHLSSSIVHPPSSILHPPSSILHPLPSTLLPSAGLFASRPRPALAGSVAEGRWRKGRAARHGPIVGSVPPRYVGGSTVAWAATLRAAAPHQAERREFGAGEQILVRAADLRSWPRRIPGGCLLLFVIDASGSMAAWKRIQQTKSAVLALLVQAYQHRDRIAFLAFRGTAAEMVLPPTRGLRTSRRVLEGLVVGGTTPLAQGLMAAGRFIYHQRRRQSRPPIWTVLLTDGRANVPLGLGDAWQDSLGQAQALRTCGAEFLVVNTETGWPRLNKAVELARALKADCLCVQEVLGRSLPDFQRPPNAARRRRMAKKRRHGLIMVVTGDGKGKTTSALGLAFRALGNGFRVFIVQYIKGKWKTGEKKLADLLRAHADQLGLDLEIRPMGDGFTWITQNREQDMATTREIWEVSKQAIASNRYDLVILDEINVVMKLGYLDPQEVIALLKSKDPALHVVLTGRGAPSEIRELADTVSEIAAVKHHYKAGIKAQQGIEF